jgi:hypothetical protein
VALEHGGLLAGVGPLALSREGLRDRRFREIYTEGAHVQPVEEPAEILVESAQGLVEQGEMHEVGFEVGHAVAEFAKGMFEGIERVIVSSCSSAVGGGGLGSA